MRLHRELKEQNLDEFFFNHVMRLQPHLVRMTVGGVKIDEERKDILDGWIPHSKHETPPQEFDYPPQMHLCSYSVWVFRKKYGRF